VPLRPYHRLFKHPLNLDCLAIDLDESEMESVTGGTNAIFFDRWLGKINAGNVNMQRITHRFLIDFNSNPRSKS